jgi:hypothetical protein
MNSKANRTTYQDNSIEKTLKQVDLSSAWSTFDKCTSTIVPESGLNGSCPGKCIDTGIKEVGGWFIKDVALIID